LAVSNQQSALSQKQTLPLINADDTDQELGIRKSTSEIWRQCPRLRPSADWDWVWDWVCVTLGWPKGGPCVAQGPRRGDPRVDLRKYLCLQQNPEKRGQGQAYRWL